MAHSQTSHVICSVICDRCKREDAADATIQYKWGQKDPEVEAGRSAFMELNSRGWRRFGHTDLCEACFKEHLAFLNTAPGTAPDEVAPSSSVEPTKGVGAAPVPGAGFGFDPLPHRWLSE